MLPIVCCSCRFTFRRAASVLLLNGSCPHCGSDDLDVDDDTLRPVSPSDWETRDTRENAGTWDDRWEPKPGGGWQLKKDSRHWNWDPYKYWHEDRPEPGDEDKTWSGPAWLGQQYDQVEDTTKESSKAYEMAQTILAFNPQVPYQHALGMAHEAIRRYA